MIVHKDEVHPGMHPAIVEADIFEKVQSLLDANSRRTGKGRNNVAHAPLTGWIMDAAGELMSPTFSRGARGKLYRYYVSTSLQQGRKPAKDDIVTRRVPVALLEAKLTDVIERTTNQKGNGALSYVTRVEIHERNVHLLMPIKYLARMRQSLEDNEYAEQDPADPEQLRLSLPLQFATCRGRTKIIDGGRPRSKPDITLIKALRSAHTMIERDDAKMPILKSAPTSPWRRKLVRLAFLAPDLQNAILTGTQPAGLILSHLMNRNMPISWEDQRVWINATSPIYNE